MELKDFVSEALRQLIDGVLEAQKHAETCGAVVNPKEMALGSSVTAYNGQDGVPVQSIMFDVAVTASEGNQKKGGIGILGGAIGLGVQAGASASNQSESRIQFSIPVLLPSQEARATGARRQ